MIRESADLGILVEYEAIFYEANAWLEFVLNLFEWLQTGNVNTKYASNWECLSTQASSQSHTSKDKHCPTSYFCKDHCLLFGQRFQLMPARQQCKPITSNIYSFNYLLETKYRKFVMEILSFLNQENKEKKKKEQSFT